MSEAGNKKKVYFSYRYDDSVCYARSLWKRLLKDFNVSVRHTYGYNKSRQIIDQIPEKVSQCDLVVLVIGQDWDGDLDEPGIQVGDITRKEIEVALNSKLKIIPVLVNEGKMPTHTDNDEILNKLANMGLRQISISSANINADEDAVVKRIINEAGLKKKQPAPTPPVPETPVSVPREADGSETVFAAIGAIIILIGTIWAYNRIMVLEQLWTVSAIPGLVCIIIGFMLVVGSHNST